MQVQITIAVSPGSSVPKFSAGLLSLQIPREGSGVPAVAGNTSRPAYCYRDNKGDSPQPRGEEECARVEFLRLGLRGGSVRSPGW